jgi:CreA protein
MNRLAFALLLGLMPLAAHAEQTIGSVSTNFRLLGPNDKVVVERLDDPKIPAISCYASFAQTGGISGGLGVATDPSEQMDAIRASFLFKHFVLTRLVDQQDKTLVYVLISTKVLHGSPANAVSAVAAQ